MNVIRDVISLPIVLAALLLLAIGHRIAGTGVKNALAEGFLEGYRGAAATRKSNSCS